MMTLELQNLTYKKRTKEGLIMAAKDHSAKLEFRRCSVVPIFSSSGEPKYRDLFPSGLIIQLHSLENCCCILS